MTGFLSWLYHSIRACYAGVASSVGSGGGALLSILSSSGSESEFTPASLSMTLIDCVLNNNSIIGEGTGKIGCSTSPLLLGRGASEHIATRDLGSLRKLQLKFHGTACT